MEEHVIVLSDFLWDLAEQWRGLLVVGLIFAILVSTGKYYLDKKAYQAQDNYQNYQLEEGVESGEEGTENKNEKNPAIEGIVGLPVPETLTYYLQYKQKKDYYDNSLIMSLDPFNERRLEMTFYVKEGGSEQADARTLVNLYNSYKNDETFNSQLIELLGCAQDPMYVRELSWTSVPGEKKEIEREASLAFKITMILPGNIEGSKVQKLFVDQLEKMKKASTIAKGSTLELVYASEYTVSSTDRLNQQTKAYENVKSAYGTFIKKYINLTPEEREEADAMIAKGYVQSGLSELQSVEGAETSIDQVAERLGIALAETEEGEEDVVTPPHFSIGNVIVGFLIGMILYILISFYRTLASQNVRSEKEIQDLTGIRSFGGLYEYPYRTALQRFLHDKKIYVRRYGTSAKPEDTRTIAETVAFRSSLLKADKITMIAAGELSEDAAFLLEKQREYLVDKHGMDVEIKTAGKKTMFYDERVYVGKTPVFIALLSKKTSRRMVVDLLNDLQQYEVSVIGTEYVETA
ncbi:MAG: hypothetical protein Q4D81_00050 [Eubacteriales bacterium]|nr:hypothetical protein [Eubacteriales bacterium]